MKPIALSIDEASKILSIGRTKIYEELAAGRLVGKKIGAKTIITADSIENWLTQLDDYKPQKAEA